MENYWVSVLALLVLILINGFYAMAEMALVSAHRTRLTELAQDGNARAQAVLDLVKDPNQYLSAVQIAISLVGILAGALGGATLSGPLATLLARVPWLAPSSKQVAFIIVVIVTTYLSLVVGELVPKRVALADAERVAMAVSGPIRVTALITRPIVSLLSASTSLGVRLLGTQPVEQPRVSEEEIRLLMREGTRWGVFQEAEEDLVEGIFHLSDRTVESVMIPRTEIEWFDLDDGTEALLARAKSAQHARYPVAQSNLDNVLGVLEIRQFLAAALEGTPDVRSLLQPPVFVPQSMPALRLLEIFKQSRSHLTLVIDEYGGLLGMAALTDLIGVIASEIPVAGHVEEPRIVAREDGSWLVDGLLPVDELKDLLDVETLPDEDLVGYQTAGGFVLSQLGHIPAPADHFEWNQLRFEVMDMDEMRIDKLLISRLPAPEESTSGGNATALSQQETGE